ncbi:MAG TPA: ATP synthase F0 subunit C [Candidatus Moranbacteria bacterium]|nr:ATP synthase F0 subunit C [Candidatus Moranbacteria bacterium]
MPQNPSAFTMAIGSLGPALAIGMIGASAVMAMARNPENSDKIQIAMIIAIAFAEAVAIYALVIALILKFTA